MKSFVASLAVCLLAVSAHAGGETPSNADARVYFPNLTDGETVKSPFTVVFGLSGMGVAPAGVEKENTGHHHLLIDRPPLTEEEMSAPLPSDDNHRHFGGGQTEVTLDLAPGPHTLQLVLGDHNHVPHSNPIVSEVIAIIAE